MQGRQARWAVHRGRAVELHTSWGGGRCRTTFGLQVTPGGLACCTGPPAPPRAYTELCEHHLTPDETGWRVGGEWVFTTPDGLRDLFDDAATWDHYAGVLCATNVSAAPTCKHLREDHPDNPWAGEVQAVLQAGLDLRDRCNAGELSEHGMATARGRLNARLGRLIDAPPPLDDAERFAAHLATEFPAVFLFLWDPSLDATNWRAEQAIRPAVVIRRCVAATAPATVPTPSRCSPASCAPPANATSTCLR